MTSLVLDCGIDGLAALFMVCFFASPAIIGALLRKVNPVQQIQMHWADWEIQRTYQYLGGAGIVLAELMAHERLGEMIGMVPITRWIMWRIRRYEEAQRQRQDRASQRQCAYGTDQYVPRQVRLTGAADATAVTNVLG